MWSYVEKTKKWNNRVPISVAGADIVDVPNQMLSLLKSSVKNMLKMHLTTPGT